MAICGSPITDIARRRGNMTEDYELFPVLGARRPAPDHVIGGPKPARLASLVLAHSHGSDRACEVDRLSRELRTRPFARARSFSQLWALRRAQVQGLHM